MQTSRLPFLVAALTLTACAASSPAVLREPGEVAYGANLEECVYPFPVHTFEFTSQGQPLRMVYLDVAPARPNGTTVVLLHGKNYASASWKGTIDALVAAGYRVVAPDQIGFFKSSKPAHYQFSFQQLAHNTHALLGSLGIERPVMVGHSTGGMLATRYALMYPQDLRQLVLINPLGLEDWKAKGVPSLTVDQWYARDLKTSAESIRNYSRSTYYGGTWKPEYEPWVQMQAGMYRGPGRETVAWNSALAYDMIYTQPVVYEFPHVRVPTLLMIGDKDNTAIGKELASPAVRATLGHYPELAQAAKKSIPGAVLVEFPECGHSPHIQMPEEFHKALLGNLAGRDGR